MLWRRYFIRIQSSQSQQDKYLYNYEVYDNYEIVFRYFLVYLYSVGSLQKHGPTRGEQSQSPSTAR